MVQVMRVGLVGGKLQPSKRLFIVVPNVLEFLENAPYHRSGAVFRFAVVNSDEFGGSVIGSWYELSDGGLQRVRHLGARRPGHEVDGPVARENDENLGKKDHNEGNDSGLGILRERSEIGETDEIGVDPCSVKWYKGADVGVEKPVALGVEGHGLDQLVADYDRHFGSSPILH